MKSVKKIHLEIVRIIAVILVIFNHTDGFIYYTETSNFVTWIFSMATACICRIAVPLFFMVSGALLLEKDESVKSLLCRRAGRIVVVLLAVSVFYYIIDVCRYKNSNANIKDFLGKLCTNGIRESLWFLYAYFSMLLILPFFRIMVKHINQELMRYLFLLKCVFTIVIPMLNELFSLSFYLNVGFIGDYFFYMILGYCMENYDMQIKKNHIVWTAGACLVGCVVADMIIMQMHYWKNGDYSQILLDMFVCIMAPLVFILVKMADKELGNERINVVIVMIGECVFGIYLLDNFVRWQLLPLYLLLVEKTFGLLACGIYVLSTFVLGLIYTIILKKIPILKKYL